MLFWLGQKMAGIRAGMRKALELYQKTEANREEAKRALEFAQADYRKKAEIYVAEISAQYEARRRALEEEYSSKIAALEGEKERITSEKWKLDSFSSPEYELLCQKEDQISFRENALVSERDQKLAQLEELKTADEEEAKARAYEESGLESAQRRYDEAQKAFAVAKEHLHETEFLLDIRSENE